MNKSKRNCLAIAALSSSKLWIKPLVKTVILPAHATNSACIGSRWDFLVEFNETNCPIDFCDIIPLPAPERFFPKIPIREESYIYCLSNTELENGFFNRDTDLDGNGPAADYIEMRYRINSKSNTSMSGTVQSVSVDTFISERGIWSAKSIL